MMLGCFACFGKTRDGAGNTSKIASPGSPTTAKKKDSVAIEASLVNVVELDFAHCSLDQVPVDDVFAVERTLETLNLQCNNIRDLPRQLFHCQGLKSLDISDNDVQSLPDALAELVDLEELNASKNLLTDLPDTIKGLRHLRVLDGSVNPLQKVPEGCTQLISLAELYLNDAFLDFLPANFGRLVKLQILELRENGLNALPKSLARLTSLRRLDLGQNDFSELPEVIGSLCQLEELWLDGNRLRSLPPAIGNLTRLNHLEASFNRLESISECIGRCEALECVALSTNDLKSLPEAFAHLKRLVTLKADDNQLESVHAGLGNMILLEDLVLSQNYLVSLPPSIGLCRRLHTLNVDDNDLEFLPPELGSCSGLRILSAHGNRLTSLPAELDHIANLAVINLTGNLIQNLPVSLMKLQNIAALWLSENQTKPLIQLNQDTDPETGQRVLTNFMLPQQPSMGLKEPQAESPTLTSVDEKAKRSIVKWAGEENDKSRTRMETEAPLDGSGQSLRREPTPFPKEMRAMAKRMQNLRNKHKDVETVREAKVTRPEASPALSVSTFRDEQAVKEQIELRQFEELERSLNVAPEKSVVKPPPYHIAAAKSKHAKAFSGLAEDEADELLNTTSTLSEASTALSSLQTVVRQPTEEDDHARQLRRVSEQLLSNPRTRQSVTGIPPSLSSRPGSIASPVGSGVVASMRRASTSSTPRSSTPLETNGLLTTIEKVARSDDEDPDNAHEEDLLNYENVSTPAPINSNCSVASKIPIRQFVDNSSGGSMSTARYVRNLPSRLPKRISNH